MSGRVQMHDSQTLLGLLVRALACRRPYRFTRSSLGELNCRLFNVGPSSEKVYERSCACIPSKQHPVHRERQLLMSSHACALLLCPSRGVPTRASNLQKGGSQNGAVERKFPTEISIVVHSCSGPRPGGSPSIAPVWPRQSTSIFIQPCVKLYACRSRQSAMTPNA